MKEIISNNQTILEGLRNQVLQECDCIEKIRKTSPSEAEYFLELAAQYFNIENMQKRQPKVIVLGTALPPEIFYAFASENPLWVFGGSRTMTAVSDSDVPRDTDPISRAMLGYLQAAPQMAKTALVVVPLVSDNQRKLAYILQDQGWNVETVHLPPYASIGGDMYDDEINRLCGVLGMHLNKRFPSFKKAALFMEKVGVAIRRFTSIASVRPEHISSSARILILNSFYMAQDLNRWLAQLSKLSDELESKPAAPTTTLPKFLLVGSPMYFCCYKIPLLLHDIGVDLCAYIDPGLYRFAAPRLSGKKTTLSSIAAAQLNYDMSGAFIDNDVLLSALKEQVELAKPDGVIWHILRGQNEYDFELIRLESYITDDLNLPVFRLETDYQYQDVEQLRVRMEAFAELTSHRKASGKEGGA
jgi:benzoyl-CoA reductase/2-hydroxyglutaryl-CoA dehydratase subunit BcrC/BadD/HgdB